VASELARRRYRLTRCGRAPIFFSESGCPGAESASMIGPGRLARPARMRMARTHMPTHSLSPPLSLALSTPGRLAPCVCWCVCCDLYEEWCPLEDSKGLGGEHACAPMGTPVGMRILRPLCDTDPPPLLLLWCRSRCRGIEAAAERPGMPCRTCTHGMSREARRRSEVPELDRYEEDCSTIGQLVRASLVAQLSRKLLVNGKSQQITSLCPECSQR
jgi:hypothetical protein